MTDLLLTLTACAGILAGWFWFVLPFWHRWQFWGLVAKQPEDAYNFFRAHPEIWQFYERPRGWGGPYRFYVPALGEVVTVYCDRGHGVEESQREFVRYPDRWTPEERWAQPGTLSVEQLLRLPASQRRAE